MYKSILVTLDGTPGAESALPTAVRIARASGAKIHLLSVEMPVAPTLPPVNTPTMPPLMPAEQGRKLADYLRGIAERVSQQGVETVVTGVGEPTAMRFDWIGGAVAHRATTMGIDLIVMTTHARAPVPRLFLGSVSKDVVSRSATPVLTVKPHHDEELDLASGKDFEEILIALDGSTFSQEIVDEAVRLGSVFGARFTLFTALSPPHLYRVAVSPDVLPLDEMNVAEMTEAAQKDIEQVADPLRARGLNVATMVIMDANAGEAILRAAATTNADLIALTTQSRSALGTLLMGSVANHVVRAADVPVLLYRPKQTDSKDEKGRGS